MSGEGGKLKGAVIGRLLKYFLAYKWTVLLAVILMVASNLLALNGPRLSGFAINAAAEIDFGGGGAVPSEVFVYCAEMVACYALSALLSYLLSYVMIRLSQKIVYTMRRQVFEHLLELPVGYFDRNQTGEIVSHLSYDIDTINASLSNDLLQMGASAITVIGSLIMMIEYSPLLVSVFVVTVPISIVFTKYKSQRVRPLFRKRSIKLGELNGYAEEMLSGQKTIKAYGRESVITGRFDDHNNDAVEAYYRADYQGSLIGPSVNFINNLSLALISMFGAMLFMAGDINIGMLHIAALTPGALSSFIQYSRRFSGPINEAANIISELQSACSAAERVFRVIDEKQETQDIPGAAVLSDVRGDVEMHGVRFGYDPERTVIHGLSLHAEPGGMVAIVGPTGAGKTTIINLLMRFYDPQDGTIKVDGNEIRQVTRDSLRLSYTMVLQDTWLFNGSVYENIAYGREGATLEEVKEAARAARIDRYIESLPQGYDTVISDDGVNISKGQKQLITIARAMLSDSSMLILDEATSNVDSRTEQQIQEAMYRLMQGRTCFVIAHRLSTVQNADVILVMRDGGIVEQGTHDELLASGGFYASLYNSQFDN